MIATSGFLTALECTKFVFGLGCVPDPAETAYSTPHTPSWFKGPTSKRKGRQETERERRRGEEKEKGEDDSLTQISGSAPVYSIWQKYDYFLLILFYFFKYFLLREKHREGQTSSLFTPHSEILDLLLLTT